MTKVFSVLAAVVLVVAAGSVCAAKDAPPDVASALIIKLLALEKNLAAGSEVSIHVIGSPALAEAFSKAVGIPIGAAKLGKVTGGDILPPAKPSVVCLADAAKASMVTEYTRREKVASVTCAPKAVEAGIALGVGVGDDGKPEVLLNMAASKAEGLNWNPAILKVARTVE
ncbi:hypothetical protein C3F09_02725 [candidate division GN15 bacterium]|uniref:YfiR family protein n=1 Tax=candidate division GN15 bacterium TaxID=2072418 RepID=A0A855XAS5_9BACT|nr:MAG: hypothetical protein C3F09_02725 [candidate division GN15 bacterium]